MSPKELKVQHGGEARSRNLTDHILYPHTGSRKAGLTVGRVFFFFLKTVKKENWPFFLRCWLRREVSWVVYMPLLASRF